MTSCPRALSARHRYRTKPDAGAHVNIARSNASTARGMTSGEHATAMGNRRKRLRGGYAMRCALVELAPHERVPCLTVRLMLTSAETGDDVTALLAMTCADGVTLAGALLSVVGEYEELTRIEHEVTGDG